MTPYDYRQATALVADAWSILEDSVTEPNRKRAAALLRKTLAVIDPKPEPEPEPEPDTTPQRSMTLQPRRQTNNRPVEVDPTPMWFWSASDAARALGICRSSIASCLNGKKETAGGFRWRYSQFSTRTGFISALESREARDAAPAA